MKRTIILVFLSICLLAKDALGCRHQRVYKRSACPLRGKKIPLSPMSSAPKPPPRLDILPAISNTVSRLECFRQECHDRFTVGAVRGFQVSCATIPLAFCGFFILQALLFATSEMFPGAIAIQHGMVKGHCLVDHFARHLTIMLLCPIRLVTPLLPAKIYELNSHFNALLVGPIVEEIIFHVVS